MKERIIQFLRSENKTSAQFAEEIGVQPSSISHIISGRNNPSLDFVLKMLSKYPMLSSDWLLFGKGIMLRNSPMDDIFSSSDPLLIDDSGMKPGRQLQENEKSVNELFLKENGAAERLDLNVLPARTRKIVCFFENNTFTEYLPTKD